MEVLVGVLAVVGIAVAAFVVQQSRWTRRENRVVPGVDTGAPDEWVGSHSREAKLHRRIRDAVRALHAAPVVNESDRVTFEADAIALDRLLVATAALPKRHRSERLGALDAAVEQLEDAAAAAVDAGATSGTAVAAVAERLRLVAKAREELDALDVATPELRPDEDGS